MARPPKSPNEPASGTPQAEPDVQTPQTKSTEDATGRVDSIARRAYERFQNRGGEHGRDQEDWFEAERELNNDRQE